MFKKPYFIPLIILLTALFLRVINLTTVPPSVTNDEVNAYYNSYTLTQTGQDFGGQSWYQAAVLTPKYYTMTELQAIVTAPWVKLTGLSMQSLRLFYALLGTIEVGLLLLVVRQPAGQIAVANLSAALLAISPWHLHMSRLGYDGLVALFFLLLACLFAPSQQKRSILLSIPFWILTFHSYHALKVNMVVYLVAVCLWQFRHKELRSVLLITLITVFGWVAVYTPFFFANSAAQERVSELSLFDNQVVKELVDQKRQASFLAGPLTTLFINKYIVGVWQIIGSTLDALNPKLLFWAGEGNAIFSNWNHGLFYILDAFFLLGGLYYLANHNRRLGIFVVSLVVIGFLPSLLNTSTQTYTLRALMAVPWAMIVIAYGIYASFSASTKFQRYIAPTILLLYLLSVAHYLFIYHALYLKNSAQAFLLHDRLLARYLHELPTNQPVQIVGHEPRGYFLRYSFYAQLDPRHLQRQWYQDSFSVNNLTFTGECPTSSNAFIIIHKDRPDCQKLLTRQQSVITDTNRIWFIYNDQLCQSDSQNELQYLFPNSYHSIRTIETAPMNNVCRDWFRKPLL